MRYTGEGGKKRQRVKEVTERGEWKKTKGKGREEKQARIAATAAYFMDIVEELGRQVADLVGVKVVETRLAWERNGSRSQRK